MKKRIISVLICILFLLSLCACGMKTVEFSYFDSNFNPFSVRRHTNFAAVALTQANLLTKVPYEDEAVIDYSAYTNGVGIADITYNEDIENRVCTYTVKIGDDVCFSDGSPVTSTDAVFSLYVYADIDYDGWAAVASTSLEGLTEYRYHNSLASEVEISDEDIQKELENPSDKTKQYIRERVVIPVLEEEYIWVSHLYTDKSYEGTEAEEHIRQYLEVNDLFAAYYAIDTSYTASDDKATLISDIADQIGMDYVTLGNIYGTDLSDVVKEYARRSLTEKALESMGGEYVDSISGIRIIDDKTFSVTLNSLSETQLENLLGVFVAPFSVYGKDCKQTENGFEIDIKSVLDTTLEPVGAGACVFEGYKEGKYVKLSENKYYYKEATIDCNVKLTETGDSSTPQTDGYFTLYEERLIVE